MPPRLFSAVQLKEAEDGIECGLPKRANAMWSSKKRAKSQEVSKGYGMGLQADPGPALFSEISIGCGGGVAEVHSSVDFPDADRQ